MIVGDDLKIELLTRLLPRTCLKLELVRLGPDEMAGDGCGCGCGELRIDPRFEVFKGAHPFVELLMMLARSLSSKRLDAEGDAWGDRTRSIGRWGAGLGESVDAGMIWCSRKSFNIAVRSGNVGSLGLRASGSWHTGVYPLCLRARAGQSVDWACRGQSGLSTSMRTRHLNMLDSVVYIQKRGQTAGRPPGDALGKLWHFYLGQFAEIPL